MRRKPTRDSVVERLEEKSALGGLILEAARLGDFESGLAALFREAGLDVPPAPRLGIRFDPLRHFQSHSALDVVHEEATHGRLRRVLDSFSEEGRRRAEYWAVVAAVEFLFSRLPQAREAGERAVLLDPRWAWGYLWRARARGVELVALRQSRLRQLIPLLSPELRRVLSDYETAEKLARDDRDVYAWRAQFLNSLDQEEASIPDLQKTIQLDPGYDWAYSLLADAYTEHGRVKEALGVCREMFKRFPRCAWAYAYRGRERGKAGLFRPAYADLEHAMRSDPRLSGLDAWIGEMLRKRGDYAGALKRMDRTLKILPNSYNALVWKARLLNAYWRVDEALECLRRAECSRKYPDEHFYLIRGEALLKAGRGEDAAADFDRAFPSSPETIWSSALARGREVPVADSKATFGADLDRLKAHDPANAWVLAFRGRFLAQRNHGTLAAGLSDLDASLGLLPENAWALRWRAFARWKMGWAKLAFQDMDLSLTLKRDDGVFWAWSGVLRFEAGDFRRAEHDLTRAVRLGPGLGGFYSYRGRVRCLTGDRVNGAADLEEGFLRGPRTEEWLSWRRCALAELNAAAPTLAGAS